MLEVTKKTTTQVTVNVIGVSVIDDEPVVQYYTHLDTGESPSIVTTILNKGKFAENQQAISEDEAEFEQYVCDSESSVQCVMDEEQRSFGDDKKLDLGGEDDDERKDSTDDENPDR